MRSSTMLTTSVLPSPKVTIIEVIYPPDRGTVGLRGSHSPLSWEVTAPPTSRFEDRHVFELELPPGEIVELRVVRNEEEFDGHRTYAVHAGDHLLLEPYFGESAARLEPRRSLEAGGETWLFDVLLPPSYAEQPTKRYPVVYVMDGQALWSTSEDPYGVWQLDTTLATLYDLEALEEILVVGLHTSQDRVNRLSPVPDLAHGGGGGPKTLAALVGTLCPHIEATYRAKKGRNDRAIMGSSMGGLFAFYAAWTRPDVFGKAACLSSSFWWSNRWAIRWAQQKPVSRSRPVLYLDSGAAIDPTDFDAHVRDGFHHTRSMFRALVTHGYEAGKNLHRLVFTGARHEAAAWAARVAIPLQLLFPREARLPVPPAPPSAPG